MKKILRKLLALNMTVIMLLAMMVPAMAGENGLYWFNVLTKDKGPGYYMVKNSLPEDVKVYEAFCMGEWVSCSMTGGQNFAHGGVTRGDELPPMPNAYIAATVITGGANVYYLDTDADNRAGSRPDDKLPFGYEWCYEQKYAADNKVTYERIEPTLNNTNFAAAPKGAYVYRSDVEFTYSENNIDSSDANESYVIYRGRTPIKKTFIEGKGWLYVLEADTDYYVVKDNGYFAGATPFNNPFTDVAEGQYYYDPVMWAVQKGITTGTSATTFAPTKSCSRAEVVTFLWRAKGKPAPMTNDIPFSDVKAGDWYTDAVLWAVENGITNGTSATTFSPDKVCTRAEVVTFLKRAVAKDVVPSATDNPFADVPAGQWYTDAVLWAVENGITTGTGGNNFSPNVTCDRGQIVTFLYRAIKK